MTVDHRHEKINLPPYQCQYNPIELIWVQVKQQVANRSKTFKIKDILHLGNQALDVKDVCIMLREYFWTTLIEKA